MSELEKTVLDKERSESTMRQAVDKYETLIKEKNDAESTLKIAQDDVLMLRENKGMLQKTMLVAEGTVRKLNPDANMWTVSRPLIDGWMSVAMRPEKVIAEEISDITEAMRRLPRLLEGMEQSAQVMATDLRA